MLILVYGSLRFRQASFIYAPFGAFLLHTYHKTYQRIIADFDVL